MEPTRNSMVTVDAAVPHSVLAERLEGTSKNSDLRGFVRV
jgi:hypothetical protein